MLASKGGVISEAMKAIHLIPKKANLFSNDYFVWVYVFSGVWQSMGWNSIIYIAALSSVDTQLYDACKIDGANRWQTIVHIRPVPVSFLPSQFVNIKNAKLITFVNNPTAEPNEN